MRSIFYEPIATLLNPPQLELELLAESIPNPDVSIDNDQWLITTSGTPTQEQIDDVIAAHDPAVKTTFQLNQETANSAVTTAQGIKSDFDQLYPAADAHYTALAGGDKLAALDIFANDATWDDAGTTTDDKLDTLRAIIALLVMAVGFLYIRQFGN